MYREEEYDYTIDWWSFGVLVYELLTNASLWYLCEENEDGQYTEEGLKEETLNFDIRNIGKKISDTSMSLLKKLLTQQQEDRLGQTFTGRSPRKAVIDLKSHDFFRSIDFEELEDGNLESPFEPRVSVIIQCCSDY